MKNITNTLLIAGILFLSACGGGTKTESTSTAPDTTAATYTIDASKSVVAWKGEVAGVYGHNGVIKISEGTITVKGDQITGGSVTIDMTTIQPLDSASFTEEQGHRMSDFVGHLSTGDFFLVEEFPTSTFVIKSFDGKSLVGDLTVKGVTKEATAEVSTVNVTAEGLTAEATLVFNRQDFGVSWVHFMKDMILSDNIEVKLSITAVK
jgi:polyisoprenoid-binding protein YceI